MSNPTSNFGWQMPTATDLVTDLPADFEVFGQAVDTALMDLKGGTTGQVLKKNTNADMDFVWSADSAGMTNPMTTTGDTIYSSSGSTPARLGIGSTGQVLTVAAGVPSWATAVSGLSLAQIATGTLSGASVTISSLSTYDTLLIKLDTILPASASNCRIRPNNNSGSNYFGAGFEQRGSSTEDVSYGGSTFIRTNSQLSLATSAVDNNFIVLLTNCKNAGFTNFDVKGYYVNSSAVRTGTTTAGIYTVAEAVSSINISMAAGNFTSGNYTVWGG